MQFIILVAWLVSGHVFADEYITVLKIQMELCKDRGRVKIGTFSSTVSISSLSHEPTIKATFKIICPMLHLQIFDQKSFFKLLSKHLW